MPTNDQILAVSVEARINKLEKEMRKASAIVGQNFDGMERRSKKAAEKIESSFAGMSQKIGAIGKNMAAGFIGGLTAGGLMGIADKIGGTLKEIAEIGDAAKRSGLGVEAYQELAYVAEQARIPVDSLTDGIKELNLRASEFVTTGSGSAAGAFKQLGYDAETLKRKLADPSALFTEIIGKLAQLDRASAIRLADEIFGGNGGEKFVQLLDEGAEGINRAKQEAHQLGLVLDSDLIDKADELDRKFNAVANTVGTALKTAIVNAAAALSSFMEQFQAFDQQTTAGLNTRLKEIGLEKLRLDNVIVETQTRLDKGDDLFGINRGALESQITTSRDKIAKLVEQEGEILSILDSRKPVAPAKEPVEITVTGGNPALTPPTVPTAPRGVGGGGGSASAMREQADAARDVISALQEELQALGQSELEQRVNAELRRAGANATDAQKASIRELVTAIDTEGKAMQQMEDAMSNAKGMAKDFLGGLIGDLRSGVDGATALANAFGRLADKLLDMALDSLIENMFSGMMGAGGGGLLGGLFGFKDGGAVHAASGGLINGPGTSTSDSIPARLSDGEFVVNAAATRRNLDLLHAINRGDIAAFAAGGLAGERPLLAANDNRRVANDNAPPITINAPITVNASGGTPAQNADLAKAMARQFEQSARTVVADELRKQSRQGNMLNSRSR